MLAEPHRRIRSVPKIVDYCRVRKDEGDKAECAQAWGDAKRKGYRCYLHQNETLVTIRATRKCNDLQAELPMQMR